MKPSEYLALAERLLAGEKCPAGFRTTVSRAYYGAFHTALAFVREMGVTIPSGPSINKHECVPHLLGNSGDADLQKAGARLENLRGERNRADYNLDDSGAEKEAFADFQVTAAKDIIASLSGCKLGKGNPGSRFEVAKVAVQGYARMRFWGSSGTGPPAR
jgi:hypothetical protein